VQIIAEDLTFIRVVILFVLVAVIQSALILPPIFILFVIFCHSWFYSERWRRWMAFYVLMCR